MGDCREVVVHFSAFEIKCFTKDFLSDKILSMIEAVSTDIYGNVEERMRSITLMNLEGHYDTYFAGSYIFEMSIW